MYLGRQSNRSGYIAPSRRWQHTGGGGRMPYCLFYLEKRGWTCWTVRPAEATRASTLAPRPWTRWTTRETKRFNA